MYSRRDFGKVAISGLSLAALPVPELWAGQAKVADSTVRGVRLGIISGGLRGGARGRGAGAAGRGAGAPGAPGAAGAAGAAPAAAPAPPPPPPAPPAPPVDPMVAIDQLIEDLGTIGASHLELNNNFGAPGVTGAAVGGQTPASPTPEYTQTREALRQWRMNPPVDRAKAAGDRLRAAGINVFSTVATISDDCTEAEIDGMFRLMQALGVSTFCTNQTRVGVAPKMVAAAARYKISPAFHNHAMVNDPNEVASVDSFRRLFAMSPNFKANLDIGHFTAGNNDAVAFIREYHDRITHLHMKDRKRDNGPSVMWGTGDTPITQVLHLIRDNKWPIICVIERDNNDEQGTPLELAKKYIDYMRKVLES